MLRKRTTILRWLLFSALHAIVICALLYSALLCEKWNLLGDPIPYAFSLLFGPLLLTPLFGYAWSEMYVQWCNDRIPPHFCHACGYNLTGNMSGTCPECGKVIGE